jgi:hypothetical protein
MSVARKILMGLSWLYVLAVLLQFFFAGLMILGTNPSDAEGIQDARDLHEGFGYAALHLTPILLVIAAAVGRVPRNLLILTVVFAVVAFVQPIWASEFQGEFLGSLHVLGAAVILGMAHAIAQQSTRLVRGEPARAEAT